MNRTRTLLLLSALCAMGLLLVSPVGAENAISPTGAIMLALIDTPPAARTAVGVTTCRTLRQKIARQAHLVENYADSASRCWAGIKASMAGSWAQVTDPNMATRIRGCVTWSQGCAAKHADLLDLIAKYKKMGCQGR